MSIVEKAIAKETITKPFFESTNTKNNKRIVDKEPLKNAAKNITITNKWIVTLSKKEKATTNKFNQCLMLKVLIIAFGKILN